MAEEGQAPDAGHGADEEPRRQHHSVRHLPAQPAHQEEAQDDLHAAQAVHQAVGQLAEAEEALRHRGDHGLVQRESIFTKMGETIQKTLRCNRVASR